MFKMRNPNGNAVFLVKTERRRDELLRLGFTLEKEKTEGINLDKLKVEELKAFAEKNGIDLAGCANKAEILKKIKNHLF